MNAKAQCLKFYRSHEIYILMCEENFHSHYLELFSGEALNMLSADEKQNMMENQFNEVYSL